MWKWSAIVTSGHLLQSCLRKKNMFKTKENVINGKFNVLDVEYRIYFTYEKTILVYFHLRLARVKKWKKSHDTCELNNHLYIYLNPEPY